MFVTPPDVVVSYPGGPARFRCISISRQVIANVQWLLNGSSLDSLTLRNVSHSLAQDEFTNQITTATLNFADIPVEYNNTIIQCSVEYTTGSFEASEEAVLLLQGCHARCTQPLN